MYNQFFIKALRLSFLTFMSLSMASSSNVQASEGSFSPEPRTTTTVCDCFPSTLSKSEVARVYRGSYQHKGFYLTAFRGKTDPHIGQIKSANLYHTFGHKSTTPFNEGAFYRLIMEDGECSWADLSVLKSHVPSDDESFPAKLEVLNMMIKQDCQKSKSELKSLSSSIFSDPTFSLSSGCSNSNVNSWFTEKTGFQLGIGMETMLNDQISIQLDGFPPNLLNSQLWYDSTS